MGAYRHRFKDCHVLGERNECTDMTQIDSIETRLLGMGHRFRKELPAKPFVRGKLIGNIVYLAAHGSSDENGNLLAVGRVGAEVSVEQAYLAAQRVAVNCLHSIKAVVGSLDYVEEIIKVQGFVNSAPGFYRQAEVVNGCTDLLVELYGERGLHARGSLGVMSLPGNQSVEADMIVRVRTA